MTESERPIPKFRSRREIHAEELARAREELARRGADLDSDSAQRPQARGRHVSPSALDQARSSASSASRHEGGADPASSTAASTGSRRPSHRGAHSSSDSPASPREKGGRPQGSVRPTRRAAALNGSSASSTGGTFGDHAPASSQEIPTTPSSGSRPQPPTRRRADMRKRQQGANSNAASSATSDTGSILAGENAPRRTPSASSPTTGSIDSRTLPRANGRNAAAAANAGETASAAPAPRRNSSQDDVGSSRGATPHWLNSGVNSDSAADLEETPASGSIFPPLDAPTPATDYQDAGTHDDFASTTAPASPAGWKPLSGGGDTATPAQQSETEVTPIDLEDDLALFPGVSEPGAETTGMRTRRLEHERRQVKRRTFWRRVRAFIIILLVLALVAGAAYYAWTFLGNQRPVAQESDDFVGEGSGQVEVVIEEGESGTAIGEKLMNAGVVKSVPAFTRAWESNKASSTIRPGTYTLKQQMSSSNAVAALLDEANRSDNTVTVNSGETVAQVIERMRKVTKFEEKDIQAAIDSPQSLGLPAEAKGKLEGWLAPGSYEISSEDTPTTVFAKMVAKTDATLDKLNIPEGQRQVVLIKASILEREVNIDEYLPKVARVIENRLAQPDGETQGKLQMDSTVTYGLGRAGGLLETGDLEKDTPYNTYLHAGLPPTPIASPSEAAIAATLKPADGKWLYFVTIDLDTGETLFAETNEEHTKNIERLNQYCAANKGKCK
ncbi:MAG: endolytic transglycosylase MltG [Actinomycetaceae bacterium]|nr:endolytic transglycosylase MltG [Actinomycetaceae bacterium]